MSRAYLLAHPAGHSLSPVMHQAAFAALGIKARYEAWDVPPQALPDAVAHLRGPGVLGANVTIPHKQSVIALLDDVTDAAAAVGAVNTVINDGGRLIGHNTDAPGFLQALLETGFDPAGKRVLLLGAGGAARAVAYALLTTGVGDLCVFNRSQDKAQALAEDFRPLGAVDVLTPDRLEPAVCEAELLVNATSVGMLHSGSDPDVSPLPVGVLPRRGLVCDLIYRPARTRLLRDAEAAGLATLNGVAMLVYQGAAALSAWLGIEAPVAVMRTAVETALGEGGHDGTGRYLGS